MQLKPYAKYRKTDLEWLPTLPVGWKTVRLKLLLDGALTYGANEAADEAVASDPRYIRITDLNSDGTLRSDIFKSLSLEKSKSYLLKDRDILLARSGATVGKSFLYRSEWGAAAYAGYLIRARADESKLIPQFLIFCLHSSYYWDWVQSNLIQATIQNLSAEKYGNLVVPVPTVPEQQAIAAFLDRETARIDTLIAKKRRLLELLELLEEKRLATITHAVTKGLDPSAPMKDSGIDWLGPIPAHWEVSKIGRCLTSLRDGTHNPPPRANGEFRLLSARNIVKGKFVLRDDDRTMDKVAFLELQRSYTVELGDVVMAAVGATTGKSAIVGLEIKNCSVQRSIAILRPNFRIVSSEFLNYWLHGQIFKAHLASLLVQYAAQGGIYLADLSAMPIVLPPVAEQVRIINRLQQQIDKINEVERRVLYAIEILIEFRSALISSAVTGSIRVGEIHSACNYTEVAE